MDLDTPDPERSDCVEVRVNAMSDAAAESTNLRELAPESQRADAGAAAAINVRAFGPKTAASASCVYACT